LAPDSKPAPCCTPARTPSHSVTVSQPWPSPYRASGRHDPKGSSQDPVNFSTANTRDARAGNGNRNTALDLRRLQQKGPHLEALCSAPERIRTSDLRFRSAAFAGLFGSVEPCQLRSGALRSPQNCGVRDALRDTAFSKPRDWRARLTSAGGPLQPRLSGHRPRRAGVRGQGDPAARRSDRRGDRAVAGLRADRLR